MKAEDLKLIVKEKYGEIAKQSKQQNESSCCESGCGCPRGITTTAPGYCDKISIDWGTQRLVNLYNAWREMLVEILYRLGVESVSALRGRTDLLSHLDYESGDGTGR